MFAWAHAHYIRVYLASSDPGIDVIAPIVWQQLDLCYALLSAILIALKAFLQTFDTSMGTDRTFAQESKLHSGGSHGLSKLSQKESKVGRKPERRSHNDKFAMDSKYRPEQTQYSTDISHPSDRQGGSIRSNSSQRPIIRYDVEYSVTHERVEVPGTIGGL